MHFVILRALVKFIILILRGWFHNFFCNRTN